MLLKYKKPMMNGPEVRRVQEGLLELGYDVGDSGPDSWFGKDTEKAVSFPKDEGLDADGIVGKKTWAALDEKLGDGEISGEGTTDGIIYIDGRHAPPKYYRADRSPRREINGVTLHQTGVLMTDTPKRFETLNAHIAVLRCGDVVIVNDPKDFIWHAQDLSHKTIGIEFNGLFAGKEGKSAPQELTPTMVKASDLLFNWLKEWFARNGFEWKYVYAHRQSKDTRQADPGYEIWQQVGMKWIERLGASDGGPDWKLDSGKPIPKDWNSDYTAKY